MKGIDMLRQTLPSQFLTNHRGAVAVYTAIVISVLLMFSALAVDVGHLYGVRNELHNAADAAALAGAEALFNPSNSSLTVQNAADAANALATANPTGNTSVANVTIQIGHWSFTDKVFTSLTSTPNLNTGLTQLATWETQTFSALDTNSAFINAVKVIARRPDTPSFFARILNFNQFNVQAEAVAYIGFAGNLLPAELDLSIGICKQSIMQGNNYSCSVGRTTNSGNNTNTSETAGWTNFTQPCQTANSSNTYACKGNTQTIQLGEGVGTTNGDVQPLLKDIVKCWSNQTSGGTKPWPVTLAVIDCPGNQVSNCSEIVGAVSVNIMWVNEKQNSNFKDAPTSMTFGANDSRNWTCSSTDGKTCWKQFVNKYNLQTGNGAPATDTDYENMWNARAIFFLPDCTAHATNGTTGGENFGILAKIPVLVQ